MQFAKVTLQEVLDELEELPSDWMDDRAHALVAHIKLSVARLRELGRQPTEDDLTREVRESADFLDVCRLFLGMAQEPAAHLLSDSFQGQRLAWNQLKSLARREPETIASALWAIHLPDVIEDHLERQWRAEDVLVERYKMTRGRAIAGQRRGRSLEDEVQTVLERSGIAFARGVTFVGKKGQTAKCDFAIPARDHPKVVIEAKGFEATGSKLTDFLGDILKIAQAKDFHMYFFLVTDGRGWHNRVSDLRKIVEYHQDNLIDMVFTLARLPALGAAVKRILENE